MEQESRTFEEHRSCIPETFKNWKSNATTQSKSQTQITIK